MYAFTTLCGHQGTIKPIQKLDGRMAGKWQCRISGPIITGKSGIKTIYSDASNEAARAKIASFLHISPSSVHLSSLTATATSHRPAVAAPLSSSCDSSQVVLQRADLRESLRQMRLSFARRLNVPAFCVFSNQTLDDIVLKLPRSKSDLMEVYGIGPEKFRKFGSAILLMVNQWCNSRPHYSALATASVKQPNPNDTQGVAQRSPLFL